MSAVILPGWAQHIREIFKSGAVNQFIITGNIDDDAPLTADGESRFSPLKTFFTETLFEPIDIILFYDRGKASGLSKGRSIFSTFSKCSIPSTAAGFLQIPASLPQKKFSIIRDFCPALRLRQSNSLTALFTISQPYLHLRALWRW